VTAEKLRPAGETRARVGMGGEDEGGEDEGGEDEGGEDEGGEDEGGEGLSARGRCDFARVVGVMQYYVH